MKAIFQIIFKGGSTYYIWVTFLLVLILQGVLAYVSQFNDGYQPRIPQRLAEP